MLLLTNDPCPSAWHRGNAQCSLFSFSPQSFLTEVKKFFFYSRWIVDMEGAPGTLYEGEKFQLLFKFSSRYPFDSPQVTALLLNFLLYF